MQRLRIGIVGCGEVTQIIHLAALAQLADRFVVTALCDASEHVLHAIGEQWHVPNRFRHYQDLLAQDDVDAVLVANPDVYHHEVTLAAMMAGKHVLVEKPMCLTLGEADAIIAAQERAGVVVQVGYMRRYAPAFIEACRLVPDLGAIRLARVHALVGRNDLITSRVAHVVRGDDIAPDIIADGQRLRTERITEAIGAVSPALRVAYGLLLGLSSHDVSAMRELLGTPQGVLYAAQRHGGLYLSAAFDYGTYVCQFETGVDIIPRFDAALEVYGRERVLRVQYDTPYVRNLPKIFDMIWCCFAR